MTESPVTKQMILDLLLDIRAQVERTNAIMRATVAEARALNEELRTLREDPSFRRMQQQAIRLKPC